MAQDCTLQATSGHGYIQLHSPETGPHMGLFDYSLIKNSITSYQVTLLYSGVPTEQVSTISELMHGTNENIISVQ